MKPNLMIVLFIILVLVAGTVHAQVTSITPIENTLQGIVNVLTGTIGTSLAVIGLCAVGILFIMGRISIMQTLMVVAGIALLFGAPSIVQEFKSAL